MFLFFLLAPILLFSIAIIIGGEQDVATVFNGAFELYVLSLFLVLGLGAMWFTLDDADREWAAEYKLPHSVLVGAVAAALLVAAALYLNTFAATLYPAIPQQFGGGKPAVARLAVDAGGLTTARALRVPFGPDSTVTLPLDIEFVTSGAYVLRLPDESVIQLDKGLVQAIQPQ